jgi:hypothetical protein
MQDETRAEPAGEENQAGVEDQDGDPQQAEKVTRLSLWVWGLEGMLDRGAAARADPELPGTTARPLLSTQDTCHPCYQLGSLSASTT